MSTPASGPAASGPLAVGETVTSASPKIELGKSKAILAAVAGTIVTGGGVFLTAIGDGAITLEEAWGIGGALLAGAGLIGGGVFAVPTAVTRKQ